MRSSCIITVLMTEAVRTSEKSVYFKASIEHYITEVSHLNSDYSNNKVTYANYVPSVKCNMLSD
jgi:hypothetical protein